MFLHIVPEPAHDDPIAPYYELLLEWIVWFIRRHGWNASWAYDAVRQARLIEADIPPRDQVSLMHRLNTIPTISQILLRNDVYEVYVRSYQLPIELTGMLLHAPESIGQVNRPIPAEVLEAAALLARQGFQVMGFIVYEGRFIIIAQ